MIGTLLAQRYRIEDQLGQGGMGVVFKAHDSLLDRPVAIKAVSAAMLGDEGSRRLLREAQSAARLTHPNIVGIYDVLEDADQRLIVMEYVAGQTLHELSPLGWPEAVDVGLQVCAALAYAHGEGVIHRDIKPENILVTPERVAKVMDFGLARSEGRSRLTQTGMVVGTVTYMAPEQALQGLATPRSDLYSLGCVLYEVITGRPPFEAEDPIAVITQHINIPPVAPRFSVPEIPPALESVILKLLAKDPHDRFTSAGQLIQVLDAVRAATQTPAAAEAKAAGAELVQAVHRGVLVGREAEVQTLKGVVDGAAAGGGRLVLVAGPAGGGKTRLAEEAITYAHLRGVRVLAAKCYEEGTPYEPVARMLREYLRTSAPEAVRNALGDYAADLVRLAPEVRQTLGTIPEVIGLPPEQERARLFEAITRLFTTLSQAAPLLLFIDDLHVADAATLQLLRYFAPAVAKERILVIGAYQPEEVGRSPALAELLRQWQRERWTASLEVKPLAPDQVGALIQGMANLSRTPVNFARRIYEVTEGNPYFIEEVINALFETGTLYIKNGQWSTDFDEGARYAEMPVPSTVRAAIDARLARLSEEHRGILTQAAVLGRRFSLTEVARLTRTDEDALLDVLDQALAARLLREVRIAGEDRYEFVQSMVRAVLYEGVSRHRRRRVHLRVAEVFEDLSATATGRKGEIADHFLEAGEEQRALPYLIAAGEEAERVSAHEEAIRRLEAARELLEDSGRTEEAMRVLETLGEPYFHAGEPEQAVAGYQRALDHYTALGDRRHAGILKRKIGRVHHLNWDFTRAIPLLEEALAELGEGEDADTLKLYLDLARAYTFGGDTPRAVGWGEKAVRLARMLGSAELEALALVELGTAKQSASDFDQAEQHLGEAIRLARKAGSYPGKSGLRRALNNLASIQWTRGELVEAREGFLEALRMAEEVGQPNWVAFHQAMAAGCSFSLGDWADARRRFEAVISLGPRGGLYARHAPVHLHLLAEDWEAAIDALERELTEREASRDKQQVTVCLNELAEASLQKGAYREAEAYARRAVEENPESFEAWSGILFTQALIRLGRLDEAVAVCDRTEKVARTGKGTGLMADIHYLRGLVAAAAGDRDGAEQHLLTAINILDRYPRPYLQAQILEDLAAVQTDPGAAREASGRALAIYERIGAQRSATRVRAAKEAPGT